VAAPISKATEPTPAKMRETIAPSNIVEYADPILLAMATMVKNYIGLAISAEQEAGRLPLSIPGKPVYAVKVHIRCDEERGNAAGVCRLL